MDVTLSVTLIGPGERTLRVNIFQDAPAWQSAGTSLGDLGKADVLEILRSLGMSAVDSEQLAELAREAPLAVRRVRLRLSPEQQRYVALTFPPL